MANYLIDLALTAGYYAKPERDISDIVFENKLKLVKSKLEQLTNKIDERVQLLEKHHTEILYDEVAINNILLSLPDRFTMYCSPSQQSLQLEQQKLRLHQERRQETAKAWSDIISLYTAAIDIYSQIQKHQSKREMMDNL